MALELSLGVLVCVDFDILSSRWPDFPSLARIFSEDSSFPGGRAFTLRLSIDGDICRVCGLAFNLPAKLARDSKVGAGGLVSAHASSRLGALKTITAATYNSPASSCDSL